MAVNILVCVKQVVDPETPASAFRIDSATNKVVPAAGIPPVVNGFCENAVEAALRIKDAEGGSVTVLSMGSGFVMDVMKKPLSMGADEMILIDDEAALELDAFGTAYALSEAIKGAGEFDLILCGRQASDWDNAHVPLGIAELLGLPCITLAQKVEVAENGLLVHRALSDGYEVFESPLPAVVTVSNELGEPRYPTLRGIMAASRKRPVTKTIGDLGLDESRLGARLQTLDLYIPVSESDVEIIEGEDEAEAGRNLALRLREEKII